MTNILGPYYSPWHWRGEDETYMRELDSAWANIHQPTARAIETVQRTARNARIMLRSWDIDDHNGDRKREMYADPKGAARKHLEMWKAKWGELLTEMHRNGWTAREDSWYLGLVNEPDPAYVRQMVEYSLEAMRLVRGTSIRLGVVASSVGTFSKPSENDHGWTQCIPLEQPINEGGHILLAHEYWQPEGPSFGEDAGNLAWRHHSIPLNVPILIREAGANGYIYKRYSKKDDAGWQRTVAEPKAETYAAQVKEYIEGCDQRVKGVLLYMLDFHSDQWQSFDTNPAMHQLLAIKDARPQVASPFAATTPPPTVHIPSVIAPGPKPVEPGPQEPSGDTWARTIDFVLRMEGGLSTDPNDPGNYVNGKFVGTNFGISAAAHSNVDIVNLTKEQAKQIYFDSYWKPSGAASMPWPLCLAVMDLAVNGGVGRAQEALKTVGHDFIRFMAWRIAWYTRIENFERYGRAWIRRCSELMMEASQ